MERCKFALWVVVVLVYVNVNIGCFEQERKGLLKLREYLLDFNGADVDGFLPGWVENTKSECCNWERVTCSPTTGHVTELSLNNLKGTSDDDEYKVWSINTSMFLPFKDLRKLDLSSNLFGHWYENKGLGKLPLLSKLEILNIASNKFYCSFLPSLKSFTSLKVLNLSSNACNGSFPARELTAMSNLEVLDLSTNELSSLTMEDSELLSNLRKLRHMELANNLFNKDVFGILGVLPSLECLSLVNNVMEGPLSNHGMCISNLAYNLSSLKVLLLRNNQLNGTLPVEALASSPHLEILDLSRNSFFGDIPPSIGALSSLKALSLAENELNGSLPARGLCELKNLEELDLHKNLFEGILPPCIRNLKSLRYFYVSENQFTGNISHLLGSLNSLVCIDLSHNRFEGLFSFSSLANHSKLKFFLSSSDNEKFEVETEYADWVPMFQLKVLMLANCNLNKLSRKIPKFLLHQHKLTHIDLSHNSLDDSFPNWLLVNNTGLKFFNMRNNSFVGSFHIPSIHNINTHYVDISENHLNGQIQANIGKVFPSIVYLNLSGNALESGIPSSIAEMSDLKDLDLSSNNLTGEVPSQLIKNCTRLISLTLSNNSLSGQFFLADFNSSQIEFLQLRDNQFTGPLTNSIFTLQLYFLDISNNYLSGEILGQMGEVTTLETLSMRNNSFIGEFPCGLFPYSFLDISYNSFSGAMTSCSNQNLISLQHLHLQGNKFSGPIPKAFLNLSGLLTLGLGDNSFSGTIPGSISMLSDLQILLLRGNQLNGSIPSQLCHLNDIRLMDLSNNYFSGSIPQCFGNISFARSEGNDFYNVDYSYVEELIAPGGWDLPSEYEGILARDIGISGLYSVYGRMEEVDFVTKSRTNSYQGSILTFISGMDLSCNKLTGKIPTELGNLSAIHALNLSRNQLSGPIPKALSNLAQLESLDLSYNKLSGNIPTELIDLNFLADFTVAHNNLSGKIPNSKAQFGTFGASSYEGNLGLCGPPLEKKCSTIAGTPYMPTDSSDETKGKWFGVDLVVLSAIFGAAYITFFVGTLTVLYINPYWRRWWFHLIEEGMYSSYYYFFDLCRKLCRGFLFSRGQL